MHISLRPLLFLTCLFPSLASAGEVWTVSPTGQGADFSSIQDAIDAAVDGDTVLIEPGIDYDDTVTIQNKTLDLLVDGADPVGGVIVVTVKDIPANKRVSLSGMSGAVEVENCAGEVLIVQHTADERGIGFTGFNTFRATDSVGVTLVDCRFLATGSTSTFSDGRPAMAVQNSRMMIYNSRAVGGAGYGDTCLGGVSNGGSGIEIAFGSSVRAVDSQFIGGPGGVSTCNFGLDGSPSNVQPGSELTMATHPEVSLSGDLVAREGRQFQLQVSGSPGSRVTSLTSTDLQYTVLPTGVGALHAATPATLLFEGIIPTSGVLSLSMDAPFLGPMDESRTRYLQVFLDGAGNTRYLSNVLALTVVDSSL